MPSSPSAQPAKARARMLLAGSALALTLSAPAAHAQLFVGASLGRSDWRELDCAGAAVTQCDRHDTAGTVRFGYRYTPWLALEGRYFDLGRATRTGRAPDPAGAPTFVARSRFSAKGLGLDAVLSWPVSERFAISGRVGVARSEATSRFSAETIPNDPRVAVPGVEGTKRATNPYYGLAVDFALTRELWLSVEAERYRIDFGGGDTPLDLLAGGFTYRLR